MLSKFNERFIKICNGNSDIKYFLEADVEYPKKIFNLHKDLPFLPERKKLVCGMEDKKICYSHKRLKSWINTKKSTQSNSIQSKSMVKTIH